MRYLLPVLLLCLSAINVNAKTSGEGKHRKNATTIGIIMGPVGITTKPSYNNPFRNTYYRDIDYGPSFAFAFTGEHYFNRSHSKLYFSLGGRLTTTYFETPYYNNYSYPQYVSSINYVNHILCGSLGVSAGLNWDIVRGQKAAFTAQLAAVPMAEAGNFRGTYQGNLAGELYIGGTFLKKISIGLRGGHRIRSYEMDMRPYAGDQFRVTHVAFDLRFRISGGGGARISRN